MPAKGRWYSVVLMETMLRSLGYCKSQMQAEYLGQNISIRIYYQQFNGNKYCGVPFQRSRESIITCQPSCVRRGAVRHGDSGVTSLSVWTADKVTGTACCDWRAGNWRSRAKGASNEAIIALPPWRRCKSKVSDPGHADTSRDIRYLAGAAQRQLHAFPL